jgi:hypothetical protein
LEISSQKVQFFWERNERTNPTFYRVKKSLDISADRKKAALNPTMTLEVVSNLPFMSWAHISISYHSFKNSIERYELDIDIAIL